MTDTPENQSPIDRAKFDVHPDIDPHFVLRVLTPRKRRMVDAYVREGTYAAGARASGYAQATVKKYVEEDPDVRKAIGEMVDQAATLAGVTLERVLQEYARIAFFDVGELVDVLQDANDPEAAIAAFAQLPADITAAISEINVEKTDGTENSPPGGKLKVKTHDKKSALQDLGRILSVFNDKFTVTDESGFGDRLERAIKKIEDMDPEEGN